MVRLIFALNIGFITLRIAIHGTQVSDSLSRSSEKTKWNSSWTVLSITRLEKMRSYEIYPGLVCTCISCEMKGFDATLSAEDDHIGTAPRWQNRWKGMCEAHSKATWASFQCKLESAEESLFYEIHSSPTPPRRPY